MSSRGSKLKTYLKGASNYSICCNGLVQLSTIQQNKAKNSTPKCVKSSVRCTCGSIPTRRQRSYTTSTWKGPAQKSIAAKYSTTCSNVGNARKWPSLSTTQCLPIAKIPLNYVRRASLRAQILKNG